MRVTFHRAFDHARDPFEALDVLLALGIDRILSSGQERSVEEGLRLVAELVRSAGDRARIVPAGGVREHNVARVLRETGARDVHFTARVARPSPMQHQNPRCDLASGPPAGAYELLPTDEGRVRRMLDAIRSLAAGAPADRSKD
jgi:copper homeostasis protein